MGILDDAIREHLELKRQHGAADPSFSASRTRRSVRPAARRAGFPGAEEAPAASANGAATETAVEERELEDPAVHEDATTLMPSSEASEDPADTARRTPAPGWRNRRRPYAADHESEEMLIDDRDEPAAEVEQEEPAAEEHQILDEPASEAAEEGTTLYDQSGDELDVDLDLQLDEEAAPAEPASEEHPVAAPEGTTPLEPPIESLDTVEHPFHEEIVDEDEEPARRGFTVRRVRGRDARAGARGGASRGGAPTKRTRRRTARTSSPTPRSSSRTRPRTTSSGSSRASRRTSTSRDVAAGAGGLDDPLDADQVGGLAQVDALLAGAR